MEPTKEALETALRDCVQALHNTREYIGVHVLPARPGWSWYDATEKAKIVLGRDPINYDARFEINQDRPRKA